MSRLTFRGSRYPEGIPAIKRSHRESASFGPFQLFPTARVLEKDGVAQKLGDRAFDILTVLVERAGEIVSHKELISRVWRGLVVTPGNLRVHINTLHNVLGDDESGARYIQNVTGQGYCFVAAVKLNSTENSTAAAPSAQPRALPPALARMIGRDDTVRIIAADLRADRFVSIVGAGGVGKTTVAVAVAHTMLEELAGRVSFVDIGAVTDPALLTATVASTLDLSIQGADALVTLMAFLQAARMLLVLDNCEHVIDAAASLVETIFTHAPNVHILVTSREALRIEGEHAHWLHPLECPPPDSPVSAATALTFSAVKLFVERATTSDHRFELTDVNAPIVADICRRLDGVALALEFVAGRVGSYGLEGTADLLGKRLGLHWQGRRTAIPRHQTLNALLDWSYGLLQEFERRALRNLSIFVGSFTLEAARGVAVEPGLDDAQLLTAVDQLIAKSLVSATRTPRGAAVYRLLETTRIFALQKLEDAGEAAEAAAERHARYFAILLTSTAVRQSDLRAGGRAPIRFEHLGNLRAALEWCLGDRAKPGRSRGTELSIELAVGAVPVLLDLSLWSECLRWSDAALSAMPDAARGDKRELVLQEAFAISAMFTGGAEVRSALARALEIARRLGETAIHLRLLASLHFYSHRIADFKNSLVVAEEIHAVARTIDDVTSWAIADWLLGSSHYVLGNQAAARELFERGFSYGDRHIGNAQHLGIYYRLRGLNGLARVQWLCGYPERALQAAREAIEEAADTTPASESYALLLACHVFLWCGDLITAHEVMDRVMAQPHWHGRLVWFHAEALALKGELLARRGSLEEGIELLRTALSDIKSKRSTNLMLTVTACALAEALSTAGRLTEALNVIDDALALTAPGTETWETPELLRVRASILAGLSRFADAESCLERSLACAHRQAAKGWELRATITLARLRSLQKRYGEAHRALSAIYEQFTEGFETQDLKTAEQLLREIAPLS